MKNNGPAHALTVKSTGGHLNVIKSKFVICTPNASNGALFVGIWDTGATNTVITQNVVDALGLKPIGITYVNTASEENVQTHQYLVDILLKQEVRITNVIVTRGILGAGVDSLIGMDIINLGDFSITNHNGNTCMSFRLPSGHEIDYVKDLKMGYVPPKTLSQIMHTPTTSQTGPCPCGSGKQYKRCCGKRA